MEWYNRIYFGKLKWLFFTNVWGLTLLPFGMFFREMDEDTHEVADYISHARIHGTQQRECIYIFYYFFYALFFLILATRKYIFRRDVSIINDNPLEKEASENYKNHCYFEERKIFSWTKYI